MDSQRLIEQFIVYIEVNQGLSGHTSRKYAGFINDLVDYCKQHELKMSELTIEQLQDFTGLHSHALGRTPATRKIVVAAVKKFYAWLYKHGQITDNTAAGLEYPKAGKKVGIKMDLQHAERLLMAPGIKTFKGLRDTAIISLLAGCGLRLSGVATLNESSLMFVNEDNKEKLYIKAREKGKKERIVPAPDDCWILVRAYLGHQELQAIDRTLPDGDRVLFVSLRNGRISPADYHGENRRITDSGIYDMLVTYGKKVGVPAHQLRPHALRHLYGTEMVESGVDLKVLKELLGHADIKSTEMYVQLAVRRLRRDADKANPLSKIKTPVTSLKKEF